MRAWSCATIANEANGFQGDFVWCKVALRVRLGLCSSVEFFDNWIERRKERKKEGWDKL